MHQNLRNIWETVGGFGAGGCPGNCYTICVPNNSYHDDDDDDDGGDDDGDGGGDDDDDDNDDDDDDDGNDDDDDDDDDDEGALGDAVQSATETSSFAPLSMMFVRNLAQRGPNIRF